MCVLSLSPLGILARNFFLPLSRSYAYSSVPFEWGVYTPHFPPRSRPSRLGSSLLHLSLSPSPAGNNPVDENGTKVRRMRGRSARSLFCKGAGRLLSVGSGSSVVWGEPLPSSLGPLLTQPGTPRVGVLGPCLCPFKPFLFLSQIPDEFDSGE